MKSLPMTSAAMSAVKSALSAASAVVSAAKPGASAGESAAKTGVSAAEPGAVLERDRGMKPKFKPRIASGVNFNSAGTVEVKVSTARLV